MNLKKSEIIIIVLLFITVVVMILFITKINTDGAECLENPEQFVLNKFDVNLTCGCFGYDYDDSQQVVYSFGDE